MKRNLAIALGLMLCLAATNTLVPRASAQEVSKMTKEELKGMLSNPDVTIIDVRTSRGWDDSTLKIKGAVREDPGDVNSWMDKYQKQKTLVFY